VDRLRQHRHVRGCRNRDEVVEGRDERLDDLPDSSIPESATAVPMFHRRQLRQSLDAHMSDEKS
jgi:hypothetical protein